MSLFSIPGSVSCLSRFYTFGVCKFTPFSILFWINEPAIVRHYSRILVSSHVALMTEKNALFITEKKCYVGQNKARKKPHSIAHIPPHSVGLSATQMMSYLGHCIGHQHLWRGTYLNCKIGWACWPQNFYIGPGSSVFSHSARSEATQSPSLISQ